MPIPTAILLTLLLAPAASVAANAAPPILGWVEMVRLHPWQAEVKAKLDTGALTSSLHAEEIERFEKDDEEWVRFDVEIEDQASEEEVSRSFERPVYRNVIIRSAGGEERRPVVLMKLCIGNTVYEEQFSLEDRDNMIYPLLLGRRTIQHLGAIDVTRTFTSDPDCDDDSSVVRQGERDSDEDIGA